MRLFLTPGERRTLTRPSSIVFRLLAFNLLLLFLPIAGILYLDVYESRLLEAQERAMVQQGRLIAAALSSGEVLDGVTATGLLTRIGQRDDARLRLYDASGRLIADSNSIRYQNESPGAVPVGQSYTPPEDVRARVLYRVGAWMARSREVLASLTRRTFLIRRGVRPATAAGTETVPSEVRAALAGRYGAATRPTSGQRSLTLSSALPVKYGDSVTGAVLVSQSTFRVLGALYSVRLRIFEVVVASLAAAALLTAVAASTVIRPIVRLRREASDLAERRTRLPGTFQDASRRDEIGDLARAMQELTRRLDEHIRGVERFASDVSHEFKNPLASIRTAAEMAGSADDPADRARFLVMLTRDVDRLERLVSDVRELARIDTQLEQEPIQDLEVATLISQVSDGLRLAYGTQPDVAMSVEPGGFRVRASADRLAQAFENVLSNARGFAPAGTTVHIVVSRAGRFCRIAVTDEGPGIPEAHLERVFERFFTYRPADGSPRPKHAGLGLAITRTIVEGYGGTITASNRPDGGARFEIALPLL